MQQRKHEQARGSGQCGGEGEEQSGEEGGGTEWESLNDGDYEKEQRYDGGSGTAGEEHTLVHTLSTTINSSSSGRYTIEPVKMRQAIFSLGWRSIVVVSTRKAAPSTDAPIM